MDSLQKLLEYKQEQYVEGTYYLFMNIRGSITN